MTKHIVIFRFPSDSAIREISFNIKANTSIEAIAEASDRLFLLHTGQTTVVSADSISTIKI